MAKTTVLKLIKDLKSDRKHTQKCINEFNAELEQKINRHNVLVKEISENGHEINKLRHLIEMYSVMDNKEIMMIWQIEKATGITKLNCPDWEREFRKTKEGFVLKK